MHIKPTTISPEHYLYSQLNKHTKTDPLNTILGHLEKHPTPSTIADTTTERQHNQCTANNQTAPDNAQNDNKKQMEEKDIYGFTSPFISSILLNCFSCSISCCIVSMFITSPISTFLYCI